MTPETLAKRIAQLPYHLRHIVAGIVAYRLSPEEPQRRTKEWLHEAARWKPLWAMVGDHETRYEWPSSIELKIALLSVGVSPRVVRDAIAVYESFGEPEIASPLAFLTGRYLTTWKDNQERKARIDSKYEWSDLP